MAFSRSVRTASKLFGFSRPSNLILFIIFAGALLGFTLLRIHYISFEGVFCNNDDPKAAPGECYWYRQKLWKAGIIMHLACVLPASLLAVFQFVPAIRHRCMLMHRLSGSLIIILVLAANVGAVIVATRVFGGTAPTQGVTIAAVALTTFGILKAYYSIKRLQIHQHRVWMLRTFSWWTHIITMRIILQIAVRVVSKLPHPVYSTRYCTEMETVGGRDFLLSLHPECGLGFPGSAIPSYFTARADWFSQDPFEKIAAVGASFAMSAWMALAIHAIAVEVYLAATPRENERLRQISIQRQRAYGVSTVVPDQDLFDVKVDETESELHDDNHETDALLHAR